MTGFVSEARRSGNPFLFRLVVIAALGGLLFGYDTGVISGALLFIGPDLHASSFDQQAIVGALLLGAVAGAIIAGWASDALGRRRTTLIAGVVYVAGALLCAFAPSATFLIGARFILGLAVGCASFVAPMYIAELAPKRIRGGLVSFNQLAIVTGILLAYIVNFAIKGVPSEWRWMLGLGAIPGLILALGMIALPESPRWLVSRGREDEAKDVLGRARVNESVDEEIGEIKEVVSEEGSLRDILADAVRPLLVIGLALAIFQQLIGINTVIYYAPTILKSAGVATSGAIQQTVFIGLTNLVFTILAVLMLDRLGRRALLLTGTAGCVVALIALGAYFASPSLQASAGWLALTSLIVYIASFAIGLGPVFWLMISEIFPLHLRGPAMAACTVANWAFNFAISFTFLTLTHAITKQGTFWVYAGMGLIALWFFATRVPETKGRTLEEIEEEALDTTERDERFERAPERSTDRVKPA